MKLKLALPALLMAMGACSPKYKTSQVTNKQLYPITEHAPQDSSILSFYQPYKVQLDSIMNDVVAVSAKELTKERPEGTLNDFFADAMYSSAKDWGIAFDFAYTNYGGLRINLPEGNIYRYKVFELMPFENTLATVKFKGEDIQKFFDFIATSGGDPISGARFTIDGKKAVDITIDGQPFDASKTYTVLTSDYMANGGDGGVIFSEAMERKDLTYKLRDGILLYLEKKTKSGERLNPVIDGRIKIK